MAGHFVIQFLGGVVLGALGLAQNEKAQLIVIVLSYAWIGAVALRTRFLIGRGGEKPSGMWSCPNCKYLNQHYAVVCEACKQPYATVAKANV